MIEQQTVLTDMIDKPVSKNKPKSKGGVIKVEVMSLDQFRSYLKGVMFVGGPTWRPDRDQWEAIVAIIDKLTVTPPQQPLIAPPFQQPTWQSSPMAPVPQRFVPDPLPPSVLGGDDGPYKTPFV